MSVGFGVSFVYSKVPSSDSSLQKKLTRNGRHGLGMNHGMLLSPAHQALPIHTRPLHAVPPEHGDVVVCRPVQQHRRHVGLALGRSEQVVQAMCFFRHLLAFFLYRRYRVVSTGCQRLRTEVASLFCFSLVGYVGKVVVFVDGLVDVVLWPREESVRNSSCCNHKLARMEDVQCSAGCAPRRCRRH